MPTLLFFYCDLFFCLSYRLEIFMHYSLTCQKFLELHLPFIFLTQSLR